MSLPSPLSDQEKNVIIQSSLGLPIKYAQIASNESLQFSQTEISNEWEKLIKNGPPSIPIDYLSPVPYDRSFDTEEEYFMLRFIQESNSTDLVQLMNLYHEHIRPFHTQSELEQKLSELLNTSNKMEIYENYAKQILVEEISANSQKHENRASRCLRTTSFPLLPPATSNEIEHLSSGFNQMMGSIFETYSNDLAILRSETHEYHIRHSAVLIGRSTDSQIPDIDIGWELDPQCPHVSRKQAVITFMQDCSFYIQNVGSRTFRVNGILHPPNQICRLQAGDILDFSDRLYMFLTNNTLIDRIQQTL